MFSSSLCPLNFSYSVRADTHALIERIPVNEYLAHSLWYSSRTKGKEHIKALVISLFQTRGTNNLCSVDPSLPLRLAFIFRQSEIAVFLQCTVAVSDHLQLSKFWYLLIYIVLN